MTTEQTISATYRKEIVRDRETRDYAMYLDGELVGYARNHSDAEAELDRLVLTQLQHAGPAEIVPDEDDPIDYEDQDYECCGLLVGSHRHGDHTIELRCEATGDSRLQYRRHYLVIDGVQDAVSYAWRRPAQEHFDAICEHWVTEGSAVIYARPAEPAPTYVEAVAGRVGTTCDWLDTNGMRAPIAVCAVCEEHKPETSFALSITDAPICDDCRTAIARIVPSLPTPVTHSPAPNASTSPSARQVGTILCSCLTLTCAGCKQPRPNSAYTQLRHDDPQPLCDDCRGSAARRLLEELKYDGARCPACDDRVEEVGLCDACQEAGEPWPPTQESLEALIKMLLDEWQELDEETAYDDALAMLARAAAPQPAPLCTVCGAAHRATSCPQIAAERLRQEQQERAGRAIARAFRTERARFLRSVAQAGASDRRAMAEAMSAYLADACAAVCTTPLGAERVLGAWLRMLDEDAAVLTGHTALN